MFRQYTQCYQHTPGDKPFNKSDLVSFAAGASAPGLIGMLVAFLSGAWVIGFVVFIIQYAVTITAIANEWLSHRLCCLPGGDQCAVGTLELPPKVDTLLGSFDNDDFFDIRLMPHRHEDEYIGPNTAINLSPPGAGPSLDGSTENHPANDIFLDGTGPAAVAAGFKGQGQTLLKPFFTDLSYDPTEDSVVNDLNQVPAGTKVTRSTLHCEAEGNFWAEMKATAAWQGLAAGGGAVVGTAAGAAILTALCVATCGIGCVIATVVGAIAGFAAGGAAGGYLAASAAFNSDRGNVNDANVGDDPLGPLVDKDQVVVFGTHVYDGFHTGWHEFHPLKAIIKAGDPKLDIFGLPYVEWDPNASSGIGSAGLTVDDVKKGLASPAFVAAAKNLRDTWCKLLTEAFAPPTVSAQGLPDNRWTIHPAVDGCSHDGAPLPPPPLN
jgi:hypothetical protein